MFFSKFFVLKFEYRLINYEYINVVGCICNLYKYGDEFAICTNGKEENVINPKEKGRHSIDACPMRFILDHMTEYIEERMKMWLLSRQILCVHLKERYLLR